MLNTPCPKCGIGTLAGPTYQRIPECLVYRCTVCGYREERPTADKVKDDALIKALWTNTPQEGR